MRQEWIGSAGNEIVGFDLLGDRVELTTELLRVSAGLAAFSGFYFAIAMLTDTTYREEFLDELTGEMRQTFEARAEYLRPARRGDRVGFGAVSTAAQQPTMVPGYRHVPGNHCGSTALRNLLAFHGLEISEEMALGLGAGVCFYYVELPDGSPSRFTNGRVGKLEEQFVELTGIELRMDTAEDPGESWRLAREVVDAGRPALLLSDLYHLDHYGKSAHFPGHAVVLAGYDDELAYLSDTGFEELQTTRLENLAKARHEQHPVYPLAGHMFSVPDGQDPHDPREAAPRAIARGAKQMFEPELGEFQGMPALERFAAEVGHWPEATEDWQWSARFNYQVIERRGTGGGNFRLMYARFLEEAGCDEARLAFEAAERWTELAAALLAASEADAPDAALWSRIDADAGRVLEAERRMWSALGELYLR